MKKKITTENKIDSVQAEIHEWINNVKFKRKLFGGVDEADVWKKFRELNSLYEKLIVAERMKNNNEVSENE